MRQLAIAGVIMLALDAVYLGVTKPFWGNVVSSVQDQKMNVRTISAAAVYAIMLLGLNNFVLRRNADLLDAFLLGIVIYGVFELTNHAIFDRWPMDAVILDTLWGGILMLSVTYFTRKIHKRA